MSTQDMDHIALSFYESLLKDSDVKLLTGPYWLNDQIISFYMEYMEHVTFAAQHQELLFVSPEVTQCIKLVEPAEISIFLEPLQANAKSFIFFALNDHGQDSVGGTHWTLLVFSRPENTFYHFDSAFASSCSPSCEQFSQRIGLVIGCKPGAKMINAKCLQQTNNYDCGVHVLCNVENVAGHVSMFGQIDGVPLLKESCVKTKRSQILKIITDLAN